MPPAGSLPSAPQSMSAIGSIRSSRRRNTTSCSWTANTAQFPGAIPLHGVSARPRSRPLAGARDLSRSAARRPTELYARFSGWLAGGRSLTAARYRRDLPAIALGALDGRLYRCRGGGSRALPRRLRHRRVACPIRASPRASRIRIFSSIPAAAISSSRSTSGALPNATCRSFLALMEHLASRGITCPQPVKNRDGKVLGKLAGRPAAIVTFLDGMWIRRPSAAHCAALGDALGAAASRRRRFHHAPRQCAIGRRLARALRRLPRARP